MSVFLKIKDVFSKKSQSKNSEMDYYVHLNDFDYEQICSDFNKEKISRGIESNLVSMCEGLYNPLGHPILDFFDPISFNILNNGGSVYFLDHHDYGGMDSDGNKMNFYGEINTKIDFGHKIIHFAGVGSGMNYYNNPGSGNSIGYVNWAKSQYIIYQKLYYDDSFPGEYDTEKFMLIKNNINKHKQEE
jgi:hypothetical protein